MSRWLVFRTSSRSKSSPRCPRWQRRVDARDQYRGLSRDVLRGFPLDPRAWLLPPASSALRTFSPPPASSSLWHCLTWPGHRLLAWDHSAERLGGLPTASLPPLGRLRG